MHHVHAALWAELWMAAMVAVCAAALRWGGPPERRTAMLIAASWALMVTLQRVAGEAAPVALLALVDTAVFVVLLVFCWRDRETWLVAAVASQALALAVHVLRALSPAMPPWTYLTALAVCSYLLLAALAWGVWERARSRGRAGVHFPMTG